MSRYRLVEGRCANMKELKLGLKDLTRMSLILIILYSWYMHSVVTKNILHLRTAVKNAKTFTDYGLWLRSRDYGEMGRKLAAGCGNDQWLMTHSRCLFVQCGFGDGLVAQSWDFFFRYKMCQRSQVDLRKGRQDLLTRCEGWERAKHQYV